MQTSRKRILRRDCSWLARSALLLLACLVVGTPQVGAAPIQVAAASRSLQAVVVTAGGWNSLDGRLQRFERMALTESWKPVGSGVPVVLGRRGLAWGRGLHPTGDLEGPRKREGDTKSPAGIFRISGAFGFAPATVARGLLHMPYTRITGDIECVDDPDSPVYNRIVDRRTVSPTWKSSERMLRFDVYRWGAVIDQNPSPVRPRGGSCVFLHVWSGPGQGTAGCTAMDEQVLKALLQWLRPEARPLLIQMPESEYHSRAASWRLPTPGAVPSSREGRPAGKSGAPKKAR